MTTIKRPYSRVYWEALDDPKFATVWDDDHALAAWLRLLVAADMAWPASAALYHGVRRASVRKLVEVGLVDMQAGGRYRIHGLDKERAARSDDARAAINIRWHGRSEGIPTVSDDDYARNTTRIRPYPDGNTEGIPSQDEQSRDETKPSKAKQRRDNARDDAFDAMALLEDLTDRTFGYTAGSPVWDTLTEDVAALGLERVAAEYRAVKASVNGDPIDPAGIVFGAHKRLYPIPGSVKALPKGKGFNPTSEEAWDAFGGKPDVA